MTSTPPTYPGSAEWLEADGLGGFASGTVDQLRTRRYHALLLAATTPPTGRVVLVSGMEAVLSAGLGTLALTRQRFAPDVVAPGFSAPFAFQPEPWPTWTYTVGEGVQLVQELFAVRGTPAVVVRFTLRGELFGATLALRPFFANRDYHAATREAAELPVEPRVDGQDLVFASPPGMPNTVVRTSGWYEHDPAWYRSFLYPVERERGLDSLEDLAAPGVLRFNLEPDRSEAFVLATEGAQLGAQAAVALAEELAAAERDRRTFKTRWHKAADCYLVKRGAGKTIVAGYPWFTDWGRDTFIALRGLCLATGRLEDARDILLEWARHVSQGMLPNRFPDRGEQPEYNSVDASLWFVVAIDALLTAYARAGRHFAEMDESRLWAAADAILRGYEQGTRHGIRLDADGLLAAGERGVQLTWMDAKVGDWVVTPRVGKPVEVQALWLNALAIASKRSERWRPLLEQGLASFGEKFWNGARGYLFDVVDADHAPGKTDASVRPNALFAAGGLPLALLDDARCRSVLDVAERELLTPLGPRTLSPKDRAYRPRCTGPIPERDGAYHQGTVWPWLMGAFVEAWVRSRGGTPEAKSEARRRFLEPMLAFQPVSGLGHVPEVADGDSPHTPRGCPFQAWSVGEAARLDLDVLAEN